MFKPTPALQGTLRRLPLSTKQAGKEYYKGNRVGSMGTITRYGNFTPDWNKIRTYVYPVHGTKNAEVCGSAASTFHSAGSATVLYTREELVSD
jgi:large subunit ribosomal protein L41